MAVLKLLRNQTLYATHADALAAITTKAEELGDGELWVATYGESPNAKSILALKRTDGLTVFDNETSGDSITDAINKLDATVGSTTVGNDKHVAVQVVEENGKLTSLTIVENDIASAALLGTKSDDQSKETAFGYIAKEVADRTAAIQALDVTDEAETKKFVTSVSETDGIISVQRGAVTSTDKTVTLKDGADGGIDISVNVDGTTIVKNNTNGTLSVASSALTQYVGKNAIDISTVDTDNEKTISLVIPNSEKVLSQDTNGLVTTIALKSVTPSSENVREEYELQGINGQKLGTDTIKIYKDQTLKSASFANQILTLTYILADGSESAVDIDMSSIILETEVENGIQAVDHKLSIKLDTTGDDTGEGKFLTVGANGLKLDGVSNAITTAIEGLDVEDTAVAGQYVSSVSETDGKIAVNRLNVSDAVLNGYVKGTKPVSTAIIADDDVKGAIAKLEHQIDDAKTATSTAIEGLDVEDTAVAGQYVSSVSETDGKIAVNRLNVSDAVLNGYVKGTDELPLAVDNTINQAFSKIEVTIENNENVTSSALNEINSKIVAMNKQADPVNGQVVTTVSETDGVVSETKAKVKDLQLGGYSKTTATGAIAGTDTINVAFSKLENTLNTANDEMLTGITGSDAITVSTKTNKNQTVSLKLDTTTKPQGFTNADNVLSITSEGLYLSSIIDCGSY